MAPKLNSGVNADAPNPILEARLPLALSLEHTGAPAAFMDRRARILHANAPFYALLRDAELGESGWVAAFEQPETIRRLVETIDDEHQLTMVRSHCLEDKPVMWLLASANAHPIEGRRDTIRLVSLHCASSAVRLRLALREGPDDVNSQPVGGEALQNHFEALSRYAARQLDWPAQAVRGARASETQLTNSNSAEAVR